MRHPVNLQNCGSYNSYKALLEKLRLVIKLKSLPMGKKYYCFNKKQEMVVINILFCVLCFSNTEDYYHRNSLPNKGSVSGLTDLERSRHKL